MKLPSDMLTTFALSLAVLTLFASSLGAQDTQPVPDSDRIKLIRLLNEKLSEAGEARDVGDWNKAITRLREAIDLDSSRDLVWFKLGDAYRGAKRYQEAVTAYNQAIQIKPFGPYYNNLGEVNGKLGNFDDAVQAYRNAVRVDPPNAAQYYFNIGAVRTNAGDLEDANEAFDEAIRTDPQLASPYYFKGINLLSEARIVQGTATVPGEAIGAFRKYLDLQPDGDYATMSRQLIDFLGRTIVTTYSRTEAPRFSC